VAVRPATSSCIAMCMSLWPPSPADLPRCGGRTGRANVQYFRDARRLLPERIEFVTQGIAGVPLDPRRAHARRLGYSTAMASSSSQSSIS
jgi:hypothetical protein